MKKEGGQFIAKDIAYSALMCALLIGGQFVFSFVAGVEIVTVLLASFAAVFGVKRGVLCAVAFSLLRCLLFGFIPSVAVVYLLYYPAFAAIFGGLGHIKTSLPVKVILCTGVAAVCTVLFTLLDDAITPLFYGYTHQAALAYFYASLSAMLPQTVCAIVTVGLLFLPITAAMERVNKR